MKTFFRRSLPTTIKYNNKVYKNTGKMTDKSIKVECLSKRLSEATDIQGRPYNPTVHYYNPIE